MEEIRLATADDVPAIAALYRSLSEQSARMRFSGVLSDASIDGVAALRADTLALVVEEGDHVVAEVRYCCGEGGIPELALTISDGHQGHGLGLRLLNALRATALERGIPALGAVVRTDNTAMVRLLQKVGCVIAEPVRDGVVMFEVGTDEYMPAWPPYDGRPRILVESQGLFDDDPTIRLRLAGFDVRRCLVGRSGTRPCPLLAQGRCRVAEDADLVACLMPQKDEDAREIADRHAAAHHLVARSMDEWRQAAPVLAEGRDTIR